MQVDLAVDPLPQVSNNRVDYDKDQAVHQLTDPQVDDSVVKHESVVEAEPTASNKAGEQLVEQVNSDMLESAEAPEVNMANVESEMVTGEEPTHDQVRRSTRPNIGQHSNPAHLPRSAISNEVANVPDLSHLDARDVLANISQTHLLMVQLVMGRNNGQT